ncbi:MAG: GntR family transcriptional regulator [Victivallaceae bacterium]|nr:GntR family transcriptional regulator [Victivallaceae bacterium]
MKIKPGKNNQESHSFRPLYKRLAEQVSAQILAEAPENGKFFCTLNDLCEKYIASITTVRKAVALLTAQGIISCKAGEGIIIEDIESLRRMTSLRCRVLLLHHHYRTKLNDFFELRLSALCQGFSVRDVASQVIYREALEDENTLAFYWNLSTGIVCGNSMVSAVLAACQTHGMRQVMVINPPANIILPENFHPVYYDFDGIVRQSVEFLQRGGCRRIIMLRNDRDIRPPDGVDVVELKEYPSVEVGRAYAEQFLSEPEDTAFWATDDFVGLGLYDGFRNHGVDLTAAKRLLVNSSPSRLLTEELGIATIGFCPMRIGEAAAAYFSGILKAGDAADCAPPIIAATANAPASAGVEAPCAQE